jgi:hypothetical protein
MTVILKLPPQVEEAFAGEAAAKGLSLDEFVSEVLLAHASEQQQMIVGQTSFTQSLSARLEQEDGVPVLRTGQPITISIIDETLDVIRRERDLASLGLLN